MSKELLHNIYIRVRHINDVPVSKFVISNEGCGATVVQFGVMRNIPSKGTITMSNLTEKVRCVASNMTTIIRRMEKQQLVVTFKNPEDKRQTLVSLTENGIKIREAMENKYERFLEDMYGVLNEEEQNTLCYLLKKIEDNFK